MGLEDIPQILDIRNRSFSVPIEDYSQFNHGKFVIVNTSANRHVIISQFMPHQIIFDTFLNQARSYYGVSKREIAEFDPYLYGGGDFVRIYSFLKIIGMSGAFGRANVDVFIEILKQAEREGKFNFGNLEVIRQDRM